MLRKLISSRLIIAPGDTQERFSFLARLRKYPILLACLSSGLLYRSYVALPQHSIYRIQKKVEGSTVHPADNLALYSGGQNGSSGSSSNLKAERLTRLRQAIEDDLPQFFNQSFFAFPSSLVDPFTVVYIEQKNGNLCKLSRIWQSVCVSAARIYYCARSFHRRLELVTILSDLDKGHVEVSFRIVLLPSPSIRDSRLSRDALMEKLEKEASWHEFRAIFYVSDAGDITEVRLTRFMPPQKPMETLRNLKQLAMLNRLSPSLPTSRRLPSPTPYLCLEDVNRNLLIDELVSLDVASPTAFAAPFPAHVPTNHQSSAFDQLMHDCSMYAPKLTVEPTTKCWSSIVADNEDFPHFAPVLPSAPKMLTLHSAVTPVLPSTSVSNILLSVAMPFSACYSSLNPTDQTINCSSTELVEQIDYHSCGLVGKSYARSVLSSLQQQSNSQQRQDPAVPGTPLFPRLIHELPNAVMMSALGCAPNSLYGNV